MKKFFIVIGVLLVLLAGGLFAVSRLVSVDNLQQQIIEKVRDATGRELAFDRPRLSFFPSVGLRLRNVTLGNPGAKAGEGGPGDALIALNEMNLQLALQPLFHHRVEVSSFMLQKPVIHLRREADGSTNWNFSKVKKAQGAETPKGGETAGGGEGSSAKSAARDIRNSGFEFKFGQMQIADGTVTYTDAAKGTLLSFEGVNLTLTWPDLSSGLQLDGEFNYKSRRVNFVLSLTDPLDFLSGKPSDGDLRISMKGFTAKAKGKFSTQGTLLSGTIDAAIDSLSDLTGWLGVGKRGLPFEKLSFVSVATASGTALRLTGAKLELDDLKTTGDVTMTLAGRPIIGATLAVDHLDLDRFAGMDKEAREGAPVLPQSATAQPPETEKKSSADWDDKPLNFERLKAADAEITIKTQGFSVRGADVGPSTLNLLLKDGSLVFNTSQATMFGGTVAASLHVNAALPAQPSELTVKLAGVEAKPLLTAFAHFSKLSGEAFATLNLTSAGDSQRALVGNLGGGGTFDFKNGELEGIDLMQILKLVQARLAEMDMGSGKTQFVDMSGTFKAVKGVLHNDDLRMAGPLVQATGAGDIDLPRKYVDYRALPKLTTAAEAADAKGLTVPVDIKGSFGAVKAKPDYKGMVAGLLGVPEGGDVKAAAAAQGKKILKGIQKDPGRLLQGLFGKPRNQPEVSDPSGDPSGAPDGGQ